MKLESIHHQAIQALILYRAAESTSAKRAGDLVGVTSQRIRVWRKDPDFSRELTSQLKAYRGHFDDVPIAHRKERVLALSEIFDKLTDSQTGLKIKVLQAIRQEVGDDKQQIEVTHTGSVGVQLPPRASTYEEWLSQNRDMDRSGPSRGRWWTSAPFQCQRCSGTSRLVRWLPVKESIPTQTPICACCRQKEKLDNARTIGKSKIGATIGVDTDGQSGRHKSAGNSESASDG